MRSASIEAAFPTDGTPRTHAMSWLYSETPTICARAPIAQRSSVSEGIRETIRRAGSACGECVGAAEAHAPSAHAAAAARIALMRSALFRNQEGAPARGN